MTEDLGHGLVEGGVGRAVGGRAEGGAAPSGLTLTLIKAQLLGLLADKGIDALGVGTEGDPALLARLLSYRTKPDPGFPVVTP
ncbi:alkyl sulfatase C-terminal domain-containing protein [Streptomyces microflavus]|uniref:alkyl sulfatase C-terminal domain-containing protein n=1 Tax=Streptomyces microflavus TaxID=1919 RepID=UPI0036838B7B